jgi:hypothetical protein
MNSTLSLNQSKNALILSIETSIATSLLSKQNSELLESKEISNL